MRCLGHVQPQALKDHFGVGRRPPPHSLGHGSRAFLQDEDAGCEIWIVLDKMEGCGQTGGAAADYQEIDCHAGD